MVSGAIGRSGCPLLLVMLACLAGIGCEGPAFVSYVITGPPKIEAIYTLADQPTLVIVDDPKQLLGNPNNATVVGANVGFHLKQNEVFTEAATIPQDRLSTYAAGLGDKYAATPIDRIGQELGAAQVIHVMVKSVNLQSKNTYYEPTAELEVKIIDADTGKRLFPTHDNTLPGAAVQPGHPMRVTMKSQTLDETRRHALPMLARSLSERIGLEVAQLFYKHLPPDAE